MKNSIVVFALIFVSFNVSAAELSSLAQAYKKSVPDTYNSIKTYAVKKWADDHNMVVYTINKQIEAYHEILDYAQNEDGSLNMIFYKAYKKWTGDMNAGGVGLNPTTDWAMVLYTFKKQTKAAAAY